ncbi:MAG: SH3 domain-containing protein [Saccharofermentanales bacterium]|jgi:uncharacterized protein YgiM (DUF1202 family)
MVKGKNNVIKNFLCLLLISPVFTIIFTVHVKAEAAEKNTEPVETTEETEKESEAEESIFEAISDEQESVTEESTTDAFTEVVQSDVTLALPISYSRSITNANQVTRYISANSIIRSSPGGIEITTLEMPLLVSGTKEGAWLRFIYNGSTAYVAMSVTTTANPEITGYAKSTVNVRNAPGGSIIGTIPRGHQVQGVLIGNMVRFTYNNKTGYVYIPLLQATPVQVTRYILANTIIRSAPNGSIITTPKMPLFVTGTIHGAWLRFTYKGNTAYVAMSMTSTDNPAVICYAKSAVYVRNAPNGSVIGTLTKGQKITGYCEGAWIRITYKGQTAYIAAKFTDTNPPAESLYVQAGPLAVRPAKNSSELIGTLAKGQKITGHREGAWIRITYNGKTAYIAAKYTTEEVVNPKTGIQKLDRVLDEARKWIGANEHNPEYKYIIDTYNKQPDLPRGYPLSYKDPWCAAFVSFIGIRTNTTDILGREVSVNYHIKFFMNKDQWIEDGTITPRPGDLVAFSWKAIRQPNNDFPNHIGFVESIDNGFFYTIEGNTSPVNCASPEDFGIDYVARKRYEIGSRVIRGFARPQYK